MLITCVGQYVLISREKWDIISLTQKLGKTLGDYQETELEKYSNWNTFACGQVNFLTNPCF